MKRVALVLLMVVSATALFAAGSRAPASEDGTAWTRSRTALEEGIVPPADAVWEPIELTGTVEMVDDHAVLTVADKTYLLAIPRIAWYSDEVASGSVITVSGNLVTDPVADQVDIEVDGHVAVDQITVNGEVLSVGAGFGRSGEAPNGVGLNDEFPRRRWDETTDDVVRGIGQRGGFGARQ